MADNFRFWLIVFLVAATIVLIGWKQPLRYRFLSKAEIYELEHPAPAATPVPQAWMWNSNRKTLLDRGSYNQSGDRSSSLLRRATPIPSVIDSR